MKKNKTLQGYTIDLINGKSIEVYEEYELPFEKSIVAKFENADENEMLTISFGIDGSIYLPKRSIVSISTSDVRKE